MDKLLRLLLSVAFVTSVAGDPSVGLADVKVTIYDGTITRGPGTYKKFELWQAQSSGWTSLHILNCGGPPCTVYFPSGELTQQGDDTFAFRDTCGNGWAACPLSVARVYKWDSDTARLWLDGLQITALKNEPRKLTITYWTEPGDFKEVPGGTSGSFPWWGRLVGKFTKGPIGTGGLTNSCNPPPTSDPAKLRDICVRHQLDINGATVNNGGEMPIATVSIPCSYDPLNRVNACSGPSPSYLPTGGLNTEETDSVNCTSSPCLPVHRVELTAKFTRANQALHLATQKEGSVMATVAQENFGDETLAVALADRYEQDFWVSFTASTESYKGIPSINPTYSRLATTIPIAFGLKHAYRVPAGDGGILLTSIASDQTGEKALPALEQLRNDRAYASFIAKPFQLRWIDVRQLQLVYKFVVEGDPYSGDPRLGNLEFADCKNASFRVRVALTDADGRDMGDLVIRLGNAEQFSRDCSLGLLNLANLVEDPQPRVDVSGLPEKLKCCTTIAASRAAYGHLFVRSISVVVDKGYPVTNANYKVRLFDAVVNGTHAADHLTIIDPKDYQTMTELPKTGRRIAITKVSGKLPLEPLYLEDNEVRIEDGQLRADVLVSRLAPESGAKYRVELCLFGGRCVPDSDYFTLE